MEFLGSAGRSSRSQPGTVGDQACPALLDCTRRRSFGGES